MTLKHWWFWQLGKVSHLSFLSKNTQKALLLSSCHWWLDEHMIANSELNCTLGIVVVKQHSLVFTDQLIWWLCGWLLSGSLCLSLRGCCGLCSSPHTGFFSLIGYTTPFTLNSPCSCLWACLENLTVHCRGSYWLLVFLVPLLCVTIFSISYNKSLCS